MDVVTDGGNPVRVDDLTLVDGGDDDGVEINESCHRADRQLEVAEPTALAEASAIATHRDTSRDHQVDGFELVDIDGDR
jgi:hypothetical protein